MSELDLDPQRLLRDIQDAWENEAVDVSNHSDTYTLLISLVQDLSDVNEDIEEVDVLKHIDGSYGRSLERIGLLVNVRRRTGESDDQLRERIRGAFIRQISGTSWSEFVETVDTYQSIERFDVYTDYENYPATVFLEFELDEYQSHNVNDDDMAELIEDSVPAGHRVDAVARGTFEFTDDSTLSVDGHDPDKGFTSDSIETGGTFSKTITSHEQLEA